MKYFRAKDGEWLSAVKRIQCCDCGLVHKIDIHVDGRGVVTFRAWRDNRATAAMRRGKKFKQLK